ncbi:MAG: hypothetical protein AAEJ16_00025, partial [Arenicellales bacterium]
IAIYLRAVFQEARQDIFNIIYRKSVVSIEVLHCTLKACSMAVPHFLSRIALPTKDQEFALRSPWYQNSNGFRFAKSRQVEKVAVGPIAVKYVAVSPSGRGARQNRDAVTNVLHQVLPSPCVVSDRCHGKNLIARDALA